MQRIGADGRRKIINLSISLTLLVVLIVLDQVCKICFKNLYEAQGETVVINNFFSFVYTVNTGCAWGFLSGKPWAQTFLKIITVIAILFFVFYYIYSIKKGYVFLQYGIAVSFAGTMGNFIDRVLLNGVTDFISLTFWGYDFPIFNIADVCLTCGVIMIITHLIFLDKNGIFASGKNEED